jgi:hypothetical protein
MYEKAIKRNFKTRSQVLRAEEKNKIALSPASHPLRETP